MAAIPQMTWNWKWKVGATAVTALAGWLASPPFQPTAHPIRASNRPPTAAAAAPSSSPAADAAVVSDIEEQARRLTRAASPGSLPPAGRDLFHFHSVAAPPRSAPHARVVPEPIAAPPPAPFPLRLTGIAEDVAHGTPQRTAIVSGPSGLELAKAGELAAPGYRVIAVGESSVDVERLSDGVRERLPLRP